MQNFLLNINLSAGVGFQTLFTNITMDLVVPAFLKDEPIVWGGELRKETYGDFQKEITLLNRAFAGAVQHGDANGSLFSFPVPTYNITPEFEWENSDIITANHNNYKNGADPYYTNSSHLPVNYSDDIFEVLTPQDDLQTKYTGGTVLHLFTDGNNMPALAAKNLIRKITEKFRLPYITISPTFSICPYYGYIAGEHRKCPESESIKISSNKLAI